MFREVCLFRGLFGLHLFVCKILHVCLGRAFTMQLQAQSVRAQAWDSHERTAGPSRGAHFEGGIEIQRTPSNQRNPRRTPAFGQELGKKET